MQPTSIKNNGIYAFLLSFYVSLFKKKKKKRKTYKDKKKTRLKSVFTKKLKRNEKFIQNSYQNSKNFKHMQPNI